MRPGRLNKPWPVPVQAGDDGRPRRVGRLAVSAVREEWLVEDGWWTRKPLRRSYFELVLEDGSDVVVFWKRTPTGGLVSPARLMRAPPPYVELHCHSAYSFGDGASDPAELAAAAAGLGYEALAITDHDGVSGAMEFAHACKGLGVRPIVGAELTVEGGCHITLLVDSKAGWGNLCRLITKAHEGTRTLAGTGEGSGMRARSRPRCRLRSSRPTPRGSSASRAAPGTARSPGAGSAAMRAAAARWRGCCSRRSAPSASASSCSARCGAATGRATAGWRRWLPRSASHASPPATPTPTTARGWHSRTRWSRSA